MKWLFFFKCSLARSQAVKGIKKSYCEQSVLTPASTLKLTNLKNDASKAVIPILTDVNSNLTLLTRDSTFYIVDLCSAFFFFSSYCILIFLTSAVKAAEVKRDLLRKLQSIARQPISHGSSRGTFRKMVASSSHLTELCCCLHCLLHMLKQRGVHS